MIFISQECIRTLMSFTNIQDEFDYQYYGNKYPDVKNSVGSSYDALWKEYQEEGIEQARFPSFQIEKENEIKNYMYGESYYLFSNYDPSDPTDVLKTKENSSNNACAAVCNRDEVCGGFVFDNTTKTCTTYKDNLYPHNGMQESQGFDVYIRSKRQDNMSDRPSLREQKIQELEEKVEDAKRQLNVAPDDFHDAEREYIEYTKGIPYYRETQEEKLKKDWKKLKCKIAQTWRPVFDDHGTRIENYEQNYNTHENTLKSYLEYLQNDNQQFKQDLQSNDGDLRVQQRKSYYENQALSERNSTISYVLGVYYVILLVALKMLVFKQKFFQITNIVIMIVLWLFPALSYYILIPIFIQALKLFQGIYTKLVPHDVYSDM